MKNDPRLRVVFRRRGRDLNPRRGLKPLTRLAGERLRPLGHLSKIWLCSLTVTPLPRHHTLSLHIKAHLGFQSLKPGS